MSRAESNATIHTTSTGLKIVHRHRRGASVDYCGVIVHVGSRNDAADLHGMAHFVEHTIFKGTQRRQSWHIINRMERVGGELNAYTTKEETVVYTAAPAGNMVRAMELIADLVTSSRFPEAELDKEREVVADEINSYLDMPADAVFDDFEDMVFADTPLGHNILGTTEAIGRITSETCRDYLRYWYTTTNMTVFYYGASSAERVVATVEREFSGLPTHKVNHILLPPDWSLPPQAIVRHIDSHQAHTVMGRKVGGLDSDDRFVRTLLTNILGGPGMNSLLNVALREKRGLVYSVEAATSMMVDCGLFTIYFGCDAKDTDLCMQLVNRQLEDLASKPLSDRTLASAKKQYLGQLAVGSDNSESVAISTGRGAMYYGDVLSSQQIIDRVQSISPAQLSATAESLLPLSSLTLSPAAGISLQQSR